MRGTADIHVKTMIEYLVVYQHNICTYIIHTDDQSKNVLFKLKYLQKLIDYIIILVVAV